MENFIHRMTLIATVIALIIPIGSSLVCFQCSRISLSGCNDVFIRKKCAIVECSNLEVCVTHNTPVLLGVPAHVIRGCFPPDYCEKVKDVSTNCSTCATKLCNSSIMVPSLPLFALLYLTLLLNCAVK